MKKLMAAMFAVGALTTAAAIPTFTSVDAYAKKACKCINKDKCNAEFKKCTEEKGRKVCARDWYRCCRCEQ
jgi:hypothetical protein